MFRPMTKYTFSWPNSVADTRLPVPSMLTISPDSARPLAEDRYTWVCMAAFRAAFASCFQCQMTVLWAASLSYTPRASRVAEPPKPTVLPSMAPSR